MLIQTFILLFAFGVISGTTEDEYCAQDKPTHCFDPDIDVDFPDSAEALNEICVIILPRFKCLVDFKNKCGDKASQIFVEKMDILNELMISACDKESEFHQELIPRLPCIKKMIKSNLGSCTPMVREALEEITSELSLERDEDGYFTNEEDYHKYYCVSEALYFSCFVASTSAKCEKETGDLVGNVLDRVGITDLTCPADIREEVKAAVAIVQPVMELKLATEEIFSMA